MAIKKADNEKKNFFFKGLILTAVISSQNIQNYKHSEKQKIMKRKRRNRGKIDNFWVLLGKSIFFFNLINFRIFKKSPKRAEKVIENLKKNSDKVFYIS